jgi:hypothetical protein
MATPAYTQFSTTSVDANMLPPGGLSLHDVSDTIVEARSPDNSTPSLSGALRGALLISATVPQASILARTHVLPSGGPAKDCHSLRQAREQLLCWSLSRRGSNLLVSWPGDSRLAYPGEVIP